MQNYRNLKVWQKAHELVLKIYRVTQNFPSDEKYGTVSQMRRSSASIPTNIAEGSARQSDADYARFFLSLLALG
jgi:four helix bundle protein